MVILRWNEYKKILLYWIIPGRGRFIKRFVLLLVEL